MMMYLVIQSLLHYLLYIIVDELKVLLTVKYIPLIVRWLATLQRHGAPQEHLTRLIDLKQNISKTLKDLDVLTIHRIKEDGMFELSFQYLIVICKRVRRIGVALIESVLG